jgi:hypothetical protein
MSRTTLANAFDSIIADLPRKLLVDAFERKLAEKSLRISRRKIHLMAARVLRDEPIHQPNFIERLKERLGFAAKELAIEFTDGDAATILEALESFTEKLPEIVEKTLETSSAVLLTALKADWGRESKSQRRDRSGFRRRLYTRWGKGLELLKMFITISREVGSEINAAARVKDNLAVSTDVMTRLHARACQISEEVVCLLENGFSDGAMARWRTLHEVSAVTSLILKHGEELAERYSAHQAIESAKAARLYQKHHQRLNQPPIKQETIDFIERERMMLLQKYGKEFDKNYGWAAKHLQIADPTLAILIEKADIDHLSPYYKMASHNVHANPKGIYFKLGHIGESEVLLAGPSNAGLTDPGHSTALSLLQITAAIVSIEPTLDDLAALRILQTLEKEVGEEFIAAHNQLEHDERHLSEDRSPPVL